MNTETRSPSSNATAEAYPQPLWTLRWTCPLCRRTWTDAHHVPSEERINARLQLSSAATVSCCRCGHDWPVHEIGIDWQPENQAARDSLSAFP